MLMPTPTRRSQASVRVLHADLDAFFASVEQRDNRHLMGRPVIVGGLGPRGVVSTASYEARRFGVRSAMAMVTARRLCPDAVFVQPDFQRYKAASDAVFAIYRDVTALVEPVSMDEAFLDIADGQEPVQVVTARKVAAAVRAKCRAEVGLALSVGGGTTKLIAKLASDSAKPDGTLVLCPEEEAPWLRARRVSELWGVGPVTSQKLAEVGVVTVADLELVPLGTLELRFGASRGRQLFELARNIDQRRVTPDHVAKSIGSEETLENDTVSLEQARALLKRLCMSTTERLRTAGVAGRTVTLKVRYGDFRTVTRSSTAQQPFRDSEHVYRVAAGLLDSVGLGHGVRLIGVSVSGLSSFVQEGLWGAEPERTGAVSAAGGLFVGARVDHAALGPGEVRGLTATTACVTFDNGKTYDLDLGTARLVLRLTSGHNARGGSSYR